MSKYIIVFIIFAIIAFYFSYTILIKNNVQQEKEEIKKKQLIINGKINISNDILSYFCFVLYKQYITDKKTKIEFSVRYKDNKTYFIFDPLSTERNGKENTNYEIYLIKHDSKILFHGYKKEGEHKKGFFIPAQLDILQKIEIKYNIDFYGKKHAGSDKNINMKYYYITPDNIINYITSDSTLKNMTLDYFVDFKKKYTDINSINKIIKIYST